MSKRRESSDAGRAVTVAEQRQGIDENTLAAAMLWHEEQAKRDGLYVHGILPKRCSDLVEFWFRARGERIVYEMLSAAARESFEMYLSGSRSGGGSV